MQETQFRTLKAIAKAVAAQFGNNCEVVIHDLTAEKAEHSIVAIENGHVSKRQLNAGPSHVVLEALKEGKEISDHLNYLTKTRGGRILRSSTVFIRDENNVPTAIFAINYDLTELTMARSIIDSLVNDRNSEAIERIPTNVNELLDELLEQSVRLIGKPVAMMTKEDKVRAISFLNEAGALLITKSGDKIARYFGISKYTLYAYLDSGTQQS